MIPPETRQACMFNALQLELVQCVGREYVNDPSTASVTLAFLPGGIWYGSVVRYLAAYGENRQVVVRSSSQLAPGMLVNLTEAWLASVHDPSRFQELILRMRRLYESFDEGALL